MVITMKINENNIIFLSQSYHVDGQLLLPHNKMPSVNFSSHLLCDICGCVAGLDLR
jgi:hypothetical protein